MSKNERTPPWKPEANDVIIPLMGPTGAGKSTFINIIAGKELTTVGHDLTSCTTQLLPIVIDSSQSDLLKNRRLVLVDTPGFGDTCVDDAEILRRIASWLETMYEAETKLAGIVYVHDISLTRMLVSTKTSLAVFQKLCGKDALKRVVICTTKWSDTYQEQGEKRTKELKEVPWKEMIDGGSTIRKFGDSHKSAWDVIAPIIEEDQIRKMDALQIQEELVVAKKLLPDTEAGRQLRYSLDQLLKMLKEASKKDPSRREELEDKIAQIRKQIREMRGPLISRVLKRLDLVVTKVLEVFTPTKVTPSSPVSAVGATLEVDVEELIVLLGETETYDRLLKLSAAEVTKFGGDESSTTEVRCWSVKREGLKPLLVVTAPSFDSHCQGDPDISSILEKIRAWLWKSCRGDTLLGIIFLRGSVHPPPSEHTHAGRAQEKVKPSKATGTVEHSEPSHAECALELIKKSKLKPHTLFAAFTSSEETVHGQLPYGFDGSVAVFQDEQASKMFDIALSKSVSLDPFLEKLQTTLEGAPTRKGRGRKAGPGLYFDRSPSQSRGGWKY